MPGDRARRVKERVGDEASGTVRNTRDLVGSTSLGDILPSQFVTLLNEVIMALPHSLGLGSPAQQVYGSLTLILFAVVTTPFTLGWSLALALPFGFTLLVGLWRLVPAINSRFRGARDSAGDLGDGDLWKRE